MTVGNLKYFKNSHLHVSPQHPCCGYRSVGWEFESHKDFHLTFVLVLFVKKDEFSKLFWKYSVLHWWILDGLNAKKYKIN